MFSSRSFTVFGLTFRSLIHFEFIFYMVLKSVLISFFNTFIYFIYLLLAALGLCCCAWAFSSGGEWKLLFIVVCGLVIVVASHVVEHGL